jgi:hypothetical protein
MVKSLIILPEAEQDVTDAIEVQGSQLTVQPLPQLRMGWNQAFAAMAEQGDDILLDAFSPTDWERVDWAWDYSHS